MLSDDEILGWWGRQPLWMRGVALVSGSLFVSGLALLALAGLMALCSGCSKMPHDPVAQIIEQTRPAAEAAGAKESAAQQVSDYWYSFRHGVVLWGAWILGATILSAFFLPSVAGIVIRFFLNRLNNEVTVWFDFFSKLFNRNLKEVVAGIEKYKAENGQGSDHLMNCLSREMGPRTKRLVKQLRGSFADQKTGSGQAG